MNDFDRVKEKLNILEVITSETGLKMKGGHLEKCPFPDCGKEKCFSIQEDKQFFKCFKCDTKGDVFTFYGKYFSTDKAGQLKRGAEKAGIVLKPGRKAEKKQADSVDLTVRERIFRSAMEHYQGNLSLNGSEETSSKEYLITAKGHTQDVLEKMRIGWSIGGLVEHLRMSGYADKDIRASGMGKVITFSDDETEHLVDVFPKKCAVYPWFERERILGLTFKDPAKKWVHQLKKEYWAEGCRFFNQDALRLFNEIIVVEGENDLVSTRGAEIEYVIGLGGGPTHVQLKALKSYAASKHLYLWMDNDEDAEKPNIKGKGYIRRICKELAGLANVRILRYGKDGDDPNDYLRAFRGDKRKEIKRLQLEAVDYVTWEIGEIANLDGLEKKLDALKNRKIFAAVADMSLSEKEVTIEKIECMSGLSKEAINVEVDQNQTLLTTIKYEIESCSNKKDINPNKLSEVCILYFKAHGRVYRDRMHRVYIWYRHETVEVGLNLPFNALMLRLTGLDPTMPPGRSVWSILASLCFNSGKLIDIASWIYTDRDTDTIYVNLNSPNSVIIKLSRGGIEEVSNVLNKDDVFLKSAADILPVCYLPDVDVKEGMRLFKELVFDSFTCEREQRYLIVCWIISAFLIDFTPYTAVFKFSGAKGSGKTTAARAISYLLYGLDNVEEQTTAAAYSTAAENPLVIMDNLEVADRSKSKSQFILHSASRVSKRKRTAGSESGTTKEKPKSLILVTAIEPFTRGEEIDRIYDIDFSKAFKSDDFIEDENIGAIKKNRNLILSSLLKFIQKDVLPRLAKRKDFMVILKKEYKGHAKDRTDEYLAMLMLILEMLLNYEPFQYYGSEEFLQGVESGDKEIRKRWIEYQDAKAKETETASNSIISLLDGLVMEYAHKMKDLHAEYSATFEKEYEEEFGEKYVGKIFRYEHPEYLLVFYKTIKEIVDEDEEEPYTRVFIELKGTAGEFVYAFNRYCKNNGIKNPYSSGAIFSSRLKNDIPILRKANWQTVDRPGFEPFYTNKKGVSYWKLRKVFIG